MELVAKLEKHQDFLSCVAIYMPTPEEQSAGREAVIIIGSDDATCSVVSACLHLGTLYCIYLCITYLISYIILIYYIVVVAYSQVSIHPRQ